MKYDLAKLMYEALMKNKSIFKKANEEGSYDLAELEEGKFNRDPNWQNEFDRFVDYFFTPGGDMPMYKYKGKSYSYRKDRQDEVELFFSMLTQDPYIPSLIEMGVFSRSEDNSYIYLEYPLTIFGIKYELGSYNNVLEVINSSAFNSYINLYRSAPLGIRKAAIKSFAAILIDSLKSLCERSFDKLDINAIGQTYKEVDYEGEIILKFEAFKLNFIDLINLHMKEGNKLEFLIVSNISFKNNWEGNANLDNLTDFFTRKCLGFLNSFYYDREINPAYNESADNRLLEAVESYDPSSLPEIYIEPFINDTLAVFQNKPMVFEKDYKKVVSDELLSSFFSFYSQIGKDFRVT